MKKPALENRLTIPLRPSKHWRGGPFSTGVARSLSVLLLQGHKIKWSELYFIRMPRNGKQCCLLLRKTYDKA